MNLNPLIEISRRYGSDPAYVLLGGGNTSRKEGNTLFVKASGHALGAIDEQGFVRMDLAKLDQIWQKQYSADDDQRETEVLADMMACRLEGESARPSVEALLHAILPFDYVVHLHPALVNGITCSQQGAQTTSRLFPSALWVELVKPGFILAKVVRDRMVTHKERTGSDASLIFLENHGIFVGAESIEGIEEIYRMVMERIESSVAREPDFSPIAFDEKRAGAIKEALEAEVGAEVLFAANAEAQRFLTDYNSFEPVSSSFTPDHIVYAGFRPLWVEEGRDPVLEYRAFVNEHGEGAKIICVQNLGIFSVGEKPIPLFFDTMAIAVYSENFGGPKFMTDEMIQFIRSWEVERYRSKVASSDS